MPPRPPIRPGDHAHGRKEPAAADLDQVWKEHLLALDHLRQGIGLRAYGQRDPLNEYKSEAFASCSRRGGSHAARRTTAGHEPRGRRRDRPQGSLHLGQGVAQRPLPLRLRPQIQALPRQAELTAAERGGARR
jgi:hypothetical protein